MGDEKPEKAAPKKGDTEEQREKELHLSEKALLDGKQWLRCLTKNTVTKTSLASLKAVQKTVDARFSDEIVGLFTPGTPEEVALRTALDEVRVKLNACSSFVQSLGEASGPEVLRGMDDAIAAGVDINVDPVIALSLSQFQAQAVRAKDWEAAVVLLEGGESQSEEKKLTLDAIGDADKKTVATECCCITCFRPRAPLQLRKVALMI